MSEAAAITGIIVVGLIVLAALAVLAWQGHELVKVMSDFGKLLHLSGQCYCDDDDPTDDPADFWKRGNDEN